MGSPSASTCGANAPSRLRHRDAHVEARARSMRRHISSRWRSAPPVTKLPTTYSRRTRRPGVPRRTRVTRSLRTPAAQPVERAARPRPASCAPRNDHRAEARALGERAARQANSAARRRRQSPLTREHGVREAGSRAASTVRASWSPFGYASPVTSAPSALADQRGGIRRSRARCSVRRRAGSGTGASACARPSSMPAPRAARRAASSASSQGADAGTRARRAQPRRAARAARRAATRSSGSSARSAAARPARSAAAARARPLPSRAARTRFTACSSANASSSHHGARRSSMRPAVR